MQTLVRDPDRGGRIRVVETRLGVVRRSGLVDAARRHRRADPDRRADQRPRGHRVRLGGGLDAPRDLLDVLGLVARRGDRGTRRRGQRPRGRVAVDGILRHPLGDDRVEFGAHRGVDGADAPRRRVQVRVHEGGQVLTEERLLRREALEEHAGKGVHVGARVDGVALEALGGHVVEGADGGAGHRQLGAGVADGVRDAEVDDVDEVVGGDEHVAGLDVAVHHAVGVRGVERLGDLGDQADGPLGRERAAAPDQRAEVGPVDEAHVDEQPAVDLAVVVDGDDVRLAQPRDSVGLALETALVLGVVGQGGRQQFQCDFAVAPRVVGAVDLAHATRTDDPLDSVLAELLHDNPQRDPADGPGGRHRVVLGVERVTKDVTPVTRCCREC